MAHNYIVTYFEVREKLSDGTLCLAALISYATHQIAEKTCKTTGRYITIPILWR